MGEAIKTKYYVTPGLRDYIYDFHSILETSDKRPILISGPTGSGKSLFIHLATEWYKKKGVPGEKITVLNCSHFDSNMVRSELFGHMKGSFTGAVKDKPGWIELSKDGVLILDEIGELPSDCQAKLLTVIEDGKYHRMGDTEIQQIDNLTVVGATNRVDLRSDFWNRFLLFNIPPLHSRRGDILYYMSMKDPDFVRRLEPWEILTILSYNWPGNVREIDRVIISIKAMKFRHEFTKAKNIHNYDEEDLFLVRRDHSDLSPQDMHMLLMDFYKGHFDPDLIDNILNSFGVGINMNPSFNPLKNFEYSLTCRNIKNNHSIESFTEYNFSNDKINNKASNDDYYEKLFNVTIIPDNVAFSHVYLGYRIFCELFFKGDIRDENNLKLNDSFAIPYPTAIKFIPKKHHKLYRRVEKSIFEFMSGVKLPKNLLIPIDVDEKKDFIAEIVKKYPVKKTFSGIADIVVPEDEKIEDSVDIFSLTEEDFKKYYYEGLINRHGSIRDIAKVLDIKEQTLYSRVASLKNK